jgi:positive regulator of sigma E activity
MNKKNIILFQVFSILGLLASIFLCVTLGDTTSYVLAGLFLFSTVFFIYQMRYVKNHDKNKKDA